MREVISFFPKVFCLNQLNITDNEIDIVIDEALISGFKKWDDKDKSSTSEYSNNFFILNNEKLLFLKEKIENDFNDYNKKELKYKNTFKMTTSWISKTKPGGLSHWHNHTNSIFSGILYLKTYKNSGDILFNQFNNKSFKLIPEVWNTYNSDEIKIQPKNKTIIYFPSEIYHKIEENKSSEDRYSLAFNFLPTGIIGEHDSQANL